MMTKKIKKRVFLLFCLLISLIICTVYMNRSLFEKEQTIPKKFTSQYYNKVEGGVRNFVKLSDDIVLVDAPYYRISEKYLTTLDGQIEKMTFLRGQYGEDDAMVMTYYDINQGMASEKTIDLLATLKDYNPGYLLFRGGSIVRNTKTNEFYLQIRYVDDSELPKELTNPELERTLKNIYYNLDKGIFEKESESFEWASINLQLGDMFTSDITNLRDYVSETQGLFMVYEEIGLPARYRNPDEFNSYLPLNLYKDYSLDKDELGSGYTLHWFGEPNSRELAYLLAPEGQDDVFKGVTLYGAYSKDGQDHVLEGYDDFFKWYQAPPEEQEE